MYKGKRGKIYILAFEKGNGKEAGREADLAPVRPRAGKGGRSAQPES